MIDEVGTDTMDATALQRRIGARTGGLSTAMLYEQPVAPAGVVPDPLGIAAYLAVRYGGSPISPHISPDLPVSPHISLHIGLAAHLAVRPQSLPTSPTSPHLSRHLPTLPTSPHISPHLPTSPQISLQVRGKATTEKMGDLVELVHTILAEAKLDSQAKVLEIYPNP